MKDDDTITEYEKLLIARGLAARKLVIARREAAQAEANLAAWDAKIEQYDRRSGEL